MFVGLWNVEQVGSDTWGSESDTEIEEKQSNKYLLQVSNLIGVKEEKIYQYTQKENEVKTKTLRRTL